MKIYVRVKEKSIYNKVEDYGNSRYMVYTGYDLNDPNINSIIAGIIAKHIGAPVGRIVLISGKNDKDKVFEVN